MHGEIDDIDGLFNDIDKIFEDEKRSRSGSSAHDSILIDAESCLVSFKKGFIIKFLN